MLKSDKWERVASSNSRGTLFLLTAREKQQQLLAYTMKLGCCCLSIVIFATATFVDGHLKKYVSLISGVHKFYGTSSVFLISSKGERPLQEWTLVHVLSRDFSRKGVLTLIINFEELDERENFYRKRIVRPLIVVLLKVTSDIAEFRENTREMKISHPIWLVIFADIFDAQLCRYCIEPKGNIFNLRFDTEMLVLCCENPILKEWWCARENNTAIADFATWLVDEGAFSVLSNKGLYARRQVVNGTQFRIALVSNSAFLRINDGSPGREKGFLGDVVNDLKRRMNFTTSATLKESRFGSFHEKTNKWSGVVGQLAEGKADLGVAEFTITTDRLNIVDFTFPLIHSRTRLYFREPDGSQVQWSSYFKAFTLEIWLMIVVLVLTTPILLTVVIVKLKGRSNLVPGLLIKNWIHVWGIFCQQGLSEFPDESPLRIAYFSIFLSALVVSAAYSASLISFLTLSSATLPFSTIDGFANDGSYQLIVYQNSSDYDLFANSNESILLKMRNLLRPWQQLPTTLEQGFFQVCKERVAFYTTEAGKRTMNIRLPCKITALDFGRTDSLAMIMPKESQFTGVVNYHIQRFQDNGMLNRLKQQYFIKANPAGTTYDAVTIGGVTPILSVLAGGIIIAFLILFFEKFYISLKRNNDFRAPRRKNLS